MVWCSLRYFLPLHNWTFSNPHSLGRKRTGLVNTVCSWPGAALVLYGAQRSHRTGTYSPVQNHSSPCTPARCWMCPRPAPAPMEPGESVPAVTSLGSNDSSPLCLSSSDRAPESPVRLNHQFYQQLYKISVIMHTKLLSLPGQPLGPTISFAHAEEFAIGAHSTLHDSISVSRQEPDHTSETWNVVIAKLLISTDFSLLQQLQSTIKVSFSVLLFALCGI